MRFNHLNVKSGRNISQIDEIVVSLMLINLMVRHIFVFQKIIEHVPCLETLLYV